MELPLAVPVGDPGGIGPTVALRATFEVASQRRVVLFGDAGQLAREAQREGLEGTLERLEPGAEVPQTVGPVWVRDTGPVPQDELDRHAPSAATGQAQWRALCAATDMVLEGRAGALVTGPVSKAAIVLAGQDFRGQTEFLAQRAGLADDDVTMMFLGPTLRVALVTTHLALRDVPDAIQPAAVERTIVHLAEALDALQAQSPTRIAVAGLNPHAGEAGLFGSEDAAVIYPALKRAAASLASRAELRGPVPAEAAFRQAQALSVEGVVAMYHDQATIASKLLDWGSAVNVTWGLPFVRTSVDHGVAYEAARAGTASAEGMRAALDMAHRLSTNSSPSGLPVPGS